MQIDDEIKPILAVNRLGIDLTREYTNEQLRSLYKAVALYLYNTLKDERAKLSADPDEAPLDASHKVDFRHELALTLEDQDPCDIVGFYTAEYLSGQPAAIAEVTCSTLMDHFLKQNLSVPPLWRDTLAGNGVVPKIYK